jgi:hypothetical protein
MGPRGKLKLTFDDGYGNVYEMFEPIDESIAREFTEIQPPMKHSVPWLPGEVQLEPFETVVDTLRKREFRKDLFTQEAKRLGILLAERMEDAEGWHDTSRIEPAREQLRGQNKSR